VSDIRIALDLVAGFLDHLGREGLKPEVLSNLKDLNDMDSRG